MESLNNHWDEARMDRLETLYREGVSFSLIAADIGVSRNAAIGKAHRMQLPQRVEVIQCKVRSRAATGPQRKRNRTVKAPERPAVEFIPGRDYRCSIDELEDCSCRYPLWEPNTQHPDRRYCGFPAASVSVGIPYCRRHTELCGCAPRLNA
jgi:GcrA cell cycle regulator